MRKIRFWLISVGACLVLAAAWGILALPGTAVAKKNPTAGHPGSISANALLLDLGAGAIQSDGGGLYINGQDAVECFVGGGRHGRGQFRLFTRTLSPKGFRTFHVESECDINGFLDGFMRSQMGEPGGSLTSAR